MSILGEPRIQINFTADIEQSVVGLDVNPSSVIPASMVGDVITNTNNLMRATWDYAFSHTYDDRFAEIRRLEALRSLSRRDIELVIVEFRSGSLVAILDWAIAIYNSHIIQALPPNVAANAIWDLERLTKRVDQKIPADERAAQM